ncbi:MAG: ATP-dependent DNA ligase [Nanoarchaeota archaeon]|nr:ATP-dependent DNA ligase [Nanoarchaeota archaeon]
MRYTKLVEVYQKLESTSKRLEKTHIISEFFKQINKEDLKVIGLLIQGRLFPNWDERKIGVAARLVLKAINTSSGISIDKIEKEWKKTGDLGKATENLIGIKKQRTLFSQELTVKKVFENLRKLAQLEGLGTVDKKVSLIAELLTSAQPLEAKYITKTVLEEMRIGVGEGSLRDSIVWAFFGEKLGVKYNKEKKDIEVEDREEYNKYVGAVQHAYDVTNDFSSVIEIAKEKGLKGLIGEKITLGKPIKVMLALKEKDIKSAFERAGKPAEIEYKYDGFRIQIHKKHNEIKLFTRRLEDVTKQFAELIPYIKDSVKGGEFIIDSECVGYDPKTHKYLPFQNISQRIRRKYDIDLMAKKFPVEINLFDIMYYDGKTLIKEDFEKRRELLEKIVKQVPRKIILAKKLVTSDEKKAESFYKEALKAGNEGVMFKKLDAPYKPGARVGYMVKLKPVMDTLDLVIVGAEWGEGKRSKWMSSFILACVDDGKFLEIGKVGTGIKEKGEGITFEQLTELLKPLIKSEKGKNIEVKPKIVVEIDYEELQKSTNYASGYALRFPRLVNLRLDRNSKDIADLDIVEDYYHSQKK